jgi:hypothetical protein
MPVVPAKPGELNPVGENELNEGDIGVKGV